MVLQDPEVLEGFLESMEALFQEARAARELRVKVAALEAERARREEVMEKKTKEWLETREDIRRAAVAAQASLQILVSELTA